MKLNTRAQTAQSPNNNSPIVLVHGLFGSLDNLGVLARDLVTDHDVLQVDMRNHGLSRALRRDDLPGDGAGSAGYAGRPPSGKGDPHRAFNGRQSGDGADGAGAGTRSNGLVVIDVAPVDYHVRRHDEIFAAINAVTDAQVATRQQAASGSCASILMKKA